MAMACNKIMKIIMRKIHWLHFEEHFVCIGDT